MKKVLISPTQRLSRRNSCDFGCAEDPTFVHPDQQNQGEREWLMKHNGGNAKEPREF